MQIEDDKVDKEEKEILDIESLEKQIEEERKENEILNSQLKEIMTETKRNEKLLDENYCELEILRNQNSLLNTKLKELEKECKFLQEFNEIDEPNLNDEHEERNHNLLSEMFIIFYSRIDCKSPKERHEGELQIEEVNLHSAKRRKSISPSKFQSIEIEGDDELVGEEFMCKKSFNKKAAVHHNNKITMSEKKEELKSDPVEIEEYMSVHTNPLNLTLSHVNESKDDIEKALLGLISAYPLDFKKQKMKVNKTHKIGLVHKKGFPKK